MDEIKVTAQQRFDLLDMTRLKLYIQNAVAHMAAKVMGSAHHYAGLSGETEKRPLIVYPFTFLKQGSPSLTIRVYRRYSLGSGNYATAVVFGTDGKLVTGELSADYKDITVAALPGSTTRYLQVRRAATDDTSEPRKFYTESSGKTTQSVYTRTIDDYDVQENTVSADSDQTLADAGWIDIGTFQTNGTDDVTALSYTPSHFEKTLLTHTIAPPAADQYVLTAGEYIMGLRQMVARMRAGSSGSRLWTDEPDNDAAFDEEGGIRMGTGDSVGTGLSPYYLRLKGQIITATVAAAAALSDLRTIMGSGLFARAPDPGYSEGHLYASNIGVTVPGQVEKNYSIPGCVFMPEVGASGVDPWEVGAAFASNQEQWGWSVVGTPPAMAMFLDIYWDHGAAYDSPWVFVPVEVLDNGLLNIATIHIETSANWLNNANLGLEGALCRYNKSTGVTDAPAGNKTFYNLAGSSRHDLNFFDVPGGDTGIVMDNEDYHYMVALRLRALTSLGTLGLLCRLKSATVQTLIREASHVY